MTPGGEAPVRVRFLPEDLLVQAPWDTPLQDIADAAGADLTFGCRSGSLRHLPGPGAVPAWTTCTGMTPEERDYLRGNRRPPGPPAGLPGPGPGPHRDRIPGNRPMTTLSALLLEKILLLDGGMGTQILARQPTVEDFGGPALEGCMELLTERRPDWIRDNPRRLPGRRRGCGGDQHLRLQRVVLGEFGLADRTEELNLAAVRLAREVARSYDRRRYVIGSAGPGTKLLTLGHITYEDLYASYLAQMRGPGGRRGGRGADRDLPGPGPDEAGRPGGPGSHGPDRPGPAPSGPGHGRNHRHPAARHRDPGGGRGAGDCSAWTCWASTAATGPDEMHAPLEALDEACPFALSCLPNAGLPVNRDGALVYPLEPEAVRRKGGAPGRALPPQRRGRLLRHHPGPHPRAPRPAWAAPGWSTGRPGWSAR